ncbi:MAG: tetratricopeptide repeat protein [Wenzhouxiangella sp.]
MGTTQRIGRLDIDPQARSLAVDGRAVHAQRKVFDLLVYFCQTPGRVVTREELLEQVWGRTVASDSVVAQAVKKLRLLLEKEAGLPDAIGTVHGIGYRLDAEVSTPLGEEANPPLTNSGVPSRRLKWKALPGLVVLVILAALFLLPNHKQSVHPPRVALLAMDNATGNSDLGWVGAGGTAILTQQLRARGIEVLSGRQLDQLLAAQTDSTDPARTLTQLTGVDAVLAPRLLQLDDGFRLELANLIDGGPGQLSLNGSDPATLFFAMGSRLAEGLRAPLPEPGGSGILDSPFLSEAYGRAFDHQQRGELQAARELHEYIVREAPDFSWGVYQLAIDLQLQGEFDAARERLQALLEQPLNDPWLSAAVRTTMGNLEWYGGDYQAAGDWYRKALERFEAAGMKGGMAAALGNLGMVASTRGEFAIGRELSLQAMAIYREQGSRINEARLLHNLGYSYKEEGHLDIALSYLEQAYDLRRQLGLQTQAANTLSAIGETKVEAGQLDEGILLLEQVLETFRAANLARNEGIILADLALAYSHQGHFERARDHALASLTMARTRGERAGIAQTALMLGRIERELGIHASADQYLSEAADLYADLQIPRGLAIALAELARQALILQDSPRFSERLARYDAAIAGSDDPFNSLTRNILSLQHKLPGLSPEDVQVTVSKLLQDFSEPNLAHAEAAVEIAESVARSHPQHPILPAVLAHVEPWAARNFAAARVLYRAARTPEDCQVAISALKRLRGDQWRERLGIETACDRQIQATAS